MIERPKRAVTRFFIPLIDVLILLFCIFLLMPFMSQPGSAESPDSAAIDPSLTPDALRKEMANLRFERDQARRQIKKLEAERGNPSQKANVFVFDIDPANGTLFYYREGKRLDVLDERTAHDVIDEQKRRAPADSEPIFVLLLPRVKSASPGMPQLRKYNQWFKDVPHRFDSPLGTLPGELEDKP